MSRSATRRVVLADAALQREALAEQMRSSVMPSALPASVPASPATVTTLAHEAVEAALVDMGLTVERRAEADGRVVFLGHAAGKDAAVVVEDGIVQADMDVPADAVHSLHTDAGEICAPSVEMSKDFHSKLSREGRSRGVPFGQVEEVGLPLRGGSGSSWAARQSRANTRQAGQ